MMTLFLLLAASLAAPKLDAKFLGVKEKRGTANAYNGGYERFDIRLTNKGSSNQLVEICPQNVQLQLLPSREQGINAFAISFDGKQWTTGCQSRTISASGSVKLSMFVRSTTLQSTAPRVLQVATSAGSYLVVPPSHIK